MLVKVYVFDEDAKQSNPDLDKHIVQYTNSQNSIDEKAFSSKQNYFLYLQKEFESRGFLLLVKPSDKNRYSTMYSDRKKLNALKAKSQEQFAFFGVNGNLKNRMISLEKLLKVLLAFSKGGYDTFYYGNSVLRPNSNLYKNFSMNIRQVFTVDSMLHLYLLFMRADSDRKQSDNKRIPVPYYVLSFLGNEFRNQDYDEMNSKLKSLFMLSNRNAFEAIYHFYSDLTLDYTEDYELNHGQDYNRMIKQQIDEELLRRITVKAARHADSNVKQFLEK